MLDFVGQHRQSSASTSLPRADRPQPATPAKQIEHGFPLLPSGCQIILDDARQRSASSRTSATRIEVSTLPATIRPDGTPAHRPSLGRLPEGERPRHQADIYRGGNLSWTARSCAASPRCSPTTHRPGGEDLEAPAADPVPSTTSTIRGADRRLLPGLLADDASGLRRSGTAALTGPTPACWSSRCGPAAAASTTYAGWPRPRCAASTPPRDELRAVIDLAFDERPTRAAAARRADSRDVPAASPRPLSARGDPRGARTSPTSRATRAACCRGCLVRAGSTSTPPHHPEEVRPRLFAHHHVPRLPDQPKLFHWESQKQPRLRHPTGQRYIHHELGTQSYFSCGDHKQGGARALPIRVAGAGRVRPSRKGSAPWPSPGGCVSRCRRRRSSRRGSSRPERRAQRDTSPACAAGGWSEQWSSRRFHLVCRSGALPARFCAGRPSPRVSVTYALPADPTAQGAGRPPTGTPRRPRGGSVSPFRGPTVTATPKTHPRSDDADG